MKTTEIWALGHKAVEYALPEKTLQCGAALHPAIEGMVPDNTGDNISEENPFYAENTGIYWIWKNKESDIKGNFTYRRWLDTKYVDELLDEYQVITCEPFTFWVTVYEQYKENHNIEDLELCESIVKEMYPECAEDWDKYINKGYKLYYASGYIMKSEEYDRWCEWLFSVLEEFKSRRGNVAQYVEDNPDKYKFVASKGEYYQKQVGGFLAERLWTFYVLHNFNRIKEMKYDLKEV